MNPALIAALLRGVGTAAARKGAQRGAASAAGGINWGGIASQAIDLLPTILQGVSMVRGLRGSQGEGNSESVAQDPDAESEKMRNAFQERFDRLDSFSVDELATAPIHLLPGPLRDTAKQIQGDRAKSEKAAARQTTQPNIRVPRGWDHGPGSYKDSIIPPPVLPPGHDSAEQRSGPPPIEDSQPARERTLKQRLSDLVFAQFERQRSQPANSDGGIGDAGASNGGSGGGSNNLPPGSKPSADDGDDREDERSSRTFREKLEDGAASVGGFVATIVKAGAAVVAFVKGLEYTNMGVLALNRDLAQYNGNLAAAYAKADVDQMQRDVHKSQQLGGPLAELSAAQSELRDSTNAMSTQFQGVGISVLTKITEGVNWLNRITGFSDATSGAVKDIREWIFGQTPEPEGGPWHTFFEGVADGKHDGFRPTFRGKESQFGEKDRKDIFGR